MHFWYVSVAGTRRGPIGDEEVLQLAAGMPEPEKLPVWREGFTEWRELGSVDELRSRLTPYAAPGQPPPPRVEHVESIARLFRRLVLLVGLWVLFAVAEVPLRAIADELLRVGAAVAAVSLIAMLALLVTISVTTYRLARELGETSPILWALVMFVPCLNLIGLLMVSNKAQWWCKRRGIAVGLLGPKRESIEALRQPQ